MDPIWTQWGELSSFLERMRKIPSPRKLDEELLSASVLIHYYALAESAVANHVGTKAHCLGPIEHWGAKILAPYDKPWSKVRDGEAGAVEVSMVRNAYAHGERRFNDGARKRLIKAGAPQEVVTATLSIGYSELEHYRARLQSLLTHGAIDWPPANRLA